MVEQVERKVYDTNDIQKILGLGRNKTYYFLEEVYKKKKPFIVSKIGKQYRVPKIPFDKWFEEGMNMD